MFDRDERIEAVASAASDWRDPEYGRRQAAVDKTLEADNSFTEEAVAFAVNQQMAQLSRSALREWIGDRRAASACTVGVLNAGNIPMVGLQDFLAVILIGHAYIGSVSSKSPALLPAFRDDLAERASDIKASFVEADALFAQADAVIATGRDQTLDRVRRLCEKHDVPASHRLLRGHSFSVAVLDGKETEDDLEKLAEDALLHEGFGCRNVAVIWAPAGTMPDALLDAFAQFRAVFPAHESTPGRLVMQQAFLEAVDTPHAYGEGLEFLMSKGDPEEQQPGHIRWSEYESLGQVVAWLDEHAATVQVVAASERLRGRLKPSLRVVSLGEAQRPALDWCPDGVDTMRFLARLSGC